MPEAQLINTNPELEIKTANDEHDSPRQYVEFVWQ